MNHLDLVHVVLRAYSLGFEHALNAAIACPLECKPEHPEENGTAAHLRTQLQILKRQHVGAADDKVTP